MIYRIYGQKDTTIYESNLRKNQNTGKDEILEITKLYDEDTNSIWAGNSRVLTTFDLTSIYDLASSVSLSSPGSKSISKNSCKKIY